MPVQNIGGSWVVVPSSGVLGVGSGGDEVSELQQELSNAGFDPGPIDGQFGPMTRAALMNFQASRGLSVDGMCGPESWGALDGAAPADQAAPAPAAAAPPPDLSGFHPTLSIGSQGGEVVTLQRALAAAGFDPGPVDGSFGPMTANAVLGFQRANGLSVDGVVGPQTWGALGGDSFQAGATHAMPPPQAGGDFRSNILAIAESQLGTMEATNNNDGEVTKYANYFGRPQESWCADFASWVVTQAGGTLNDPYCPTIRNTLINNGLWKGRNDPQPGDLVLFDWDQDGVADHVGLVKSVNPNGTLTTIEGNTGNGPGTQEGVWEKTQGWDFVMGFGNPF